MIQDVEGVFNILASPNGEFLGISGEYRDENHVYKSRSFIIRTSDWNIIYRVERSLDDGAVWTSGYFVDVWKGVSIVNLHTMVKNEIKSICVNEEVYLLPSGDLLTVSSPITQSHGESVPISIVLWKANYQSKPICKNGVIVGIEKDNMPSTTSSGLTSPLSVHTTNTKTKTININLESFPLIIVAVVIGIVVVIAAVLLIRR